MTGETIHSTVEAWLTTIGAEGVRGLSALGL